MHFSNDIARGSARPVLQRQISDVEWRGFAVAAGAIVRGTLCDSKDAACILKLEVFESHVGGVTSATASSVWWVAGADSCPRLDVDTVTHVVDCDVACCDVFDCFVAVLVLPDAADGHAEASVKVAVFDEDVGTVGFGAD